MRAANNNRWLVIGGRVTIAVSLLLAWEGGAEAGLLSPLFFSRPSEVALRIWRWVVTGSLWPHLLMTSVEASLSFGIGVSLGVFFGFLLARLPVLSALLDPYIRIANAVPRVVLAPIFLLWFGLGIWSKIALGVTVVFFVVFFNAFRGVREVDGVLIDNARMLGATERDLIRHVLIPSALTWIFSSLHVSIGLAIVAVVVGEYLGASGGIGYLIAQAEGVFDTTGVFAGMAVLAVGVLTVGVFVEHAERRLLAWKPSREGAGSDGAT
jgi:NitT/TauT family transport system permease protein